NERRTAAITQAVTKGLNPDAPMKDSGIEWLGEVPEHWDVLPLKRVGRMTTGSTPTKAETGDMGTGVGWVTADELSRHSIPSVDLTSEQLSQVRVVQDAVLICGIGSIGKVGYSPGP